MACRDSSNTAIDRAHSNMNSICERSRVSSHIRSLLLESVQEALALEAPHMGRGLPVEYWDRDQKTHARVVARRNSLMVNTSPISTPLSCRFPSPG